MEYEMGYDIDGKKKICMNSLTIHNDEIYFVAKFPPKWKKKKPHIYLHINAGASSHGFLITLTESKTEENETNDGRNLLRKAKSISKLGFILLNALTAFDDSLKF
ncbi:CLUMA_CG017932, isoform A [Clunio marinus]|uniref:CLUMA_CG017932, isoform A n=1 Tax=Clunio marinus TaxID=568069 RepID=A0A1J1J1Z7_9DIPT|nr:CLUMA_CG017932, isoform A [Clunio marinus]